MIHKNAKYIKEAKTFIDEVAAEPGGEMHTMRGMQRIVLHSRVVGVHSQTNYCHDQGRHEE
jgi:hypothetical protein